MVSVHLQVVPDLKYKEMGQYSRKLHGSSNFPSEPLSQPLFSDSLLGYTLKEGIKVQSLLHL